MRSFPHNPKVETLPETKARSVEGRTRLLARGQPSDLVLAAGQSLLLAGLAHAEEQPVAVIAKHVQDGLAQFAAALEARHAPAPRDMWDWVLIALAIGDRSSTHFFASTPDDLWVQE